MKQEDKLMFFTIFALKITLCAEETVQLVKALLCQHQDLSSNPRAKVRCAWNTSAVEVVTGGPLRLSCKPAWGRTVPEGKHQGLTPGLCVHTHWHTTALLSSLFEMWLMNLTQEPSNQSGIYLYYDRIAPLKIYLII